MSRINEHPIFHKSRKMYTNENKWSNGIIYLNYLCWIIYTDVYRALLFD